MSESTIRYTAQSSIVPWILVSYPPDFERLCQVYQEVAAAAGRKLGLGESVGAFSAVHFGRTEEEAVELLRRPTTPASTYFGGFGFCEAFRPWRTEKYPLAPRCCRRRSGPSSACATPNTRWQVRPTR